MDNNDPAAPPDSPTGSDTASAPKRYTLRPADSGGIARPSKIDYQAELNEAQLTAVRNVLGPQLVIAGAGSGKTRTLVFRVAYLIERGVDPESILLLTFTRKSAQEMMRRAALLLDERCRLIKGGTFHGFANSILRRNARLLGYDAAFSIVDRGDAEDILNMVRTELGLGSSEKRFPKKGTLLAILSKARNTGKSYQTILFDEYPQFVQEEEKIKTLSDAYDAYKLKRSIMDYDDLLIYLRRLLDEHPQVRSAISRENAFIMIDEFQDTNVLQADIAALLASEHGNLMAVGDDSQSIYSFRGANFRNIMEFPKRFPKCTVTRLEQNYRSTQPILALANAITASATEKYEKTLFTAVVSDDKPVFLRPLNLEEQAGFIAQRVLELREEGIALDRIAVLFRSGWQSNELELELSRRNIPFVKYGGLKFVDAAHVKDVVSLLRVMDNPKDALAWHRQLLLLEGIGPKTASKIAETILSNPSGYQTLIGNEYLTQKYAPALKNLHDVLDRAIRAQADPETTVAEIIAYYRPLMKLHYEDYRKRDDDLDSLCRIASRYRTLRQLLDDIALEPPDQSQVGAEAIDREDEKLVLSTIHSAKGLEWHAVFVISLIDGFLPSSQSLHSAEEIEEERRLLYVACTRAERQLYLVSPELCRSRGFAGVTPGFTFSEPSRFLNDIPNIADLTDTWLLDSHNIVF